MSNNKNKAYVITRGKYSSYHIEAVFDDKKMAKKFYQKRQSKNNIDPLHFETYDMNKYDKPDKLIPFSVTKIYHEDGDRYERAEWDKYKEEKDGDPIKEIKVEEGNCETDYSFITIGRDGDFRKFYGLVLAQDKSHALKQVGEYALQYNQRNPLPWLKNNKKQDD